MDNDLTELSIGQAQPARSAIGTERVLQIARRYSSVHVFYFGAGTDNHVYQLRIFPGGPGWVWEDLTSLADGIVPEVSRALSGFWGTDDSQHIHYIGSGNHIHELYRASSAGPTDWTDNDLTALAGAVAPHPNTALVSYWAGDSSMHIFFIGVDNHVHQLSIAHGTDFWSDQDLTALLAGEMVRPQREHRTRRLCGRRRRPAPVLRGDGRGDPRALLRAWMQSPGFDHSLTKVTHALAPNVGTALDAYQGTDNSVHVNYFGGDGHVHEIYGSPQNAGLRLRRQRPDENGERGRPCHR